MRLISQFATHFWSGCFVGLYGIVGRFSLYYLNSKGRKVGMFVRWVQSIECRLFATLTTPFILATPPALSTH
jgi:hypothetical protein